jgi:choline dehydrogenase-like flavoprotein
MDRARLGLLSNLECFNGYFGADMKIAVVGSGPASFGALLAIQQWAPNAQVTIFDIGDELNESSEPVLPANSASFYDQIYRELHTQFGHQFPPMKTHFTQTLPRYVVGGEKRFFRSSLSGGLSKLWGGTMLPFSEQDFSGWPIDPTEMRPYYEKISSCVGISGQKDSLNKVIYDYSNLPPIVPLSQISKLAETINANSQQDEVRLYAGLNRVALETRSERSNSCVYCGECMAGCFRSAVFSTDHFIKTLLGNERVTFVKGKVSHFVEQSEGIKVHDEMGTDLVFDRLFLAAGAVGSAEISMRSLPFSGGSRLVDNTIYQFPIFNLNSEKKPSNENYLALSNLLVFCESEDKSIWNTQVQIYPGFDYLWRRALPETVWKMFLPMSRLLRRHLFFARMYAHSSDSYIYDLSLDRNRNLHVEEAQKPRFGAVAPSISAFQKSINRNGYWSPQFLRPMKSKTSSHYAGTLPYGGKQGVSKSSELVPRVYVCDSSVFPHSPATSLTFTIMANSHRVVTQSFGESL